MSEEREGCCGGHGNGEGHEGCCGGHGHGEGKEGCCGGHGQEKGQGGCGCGNHGGEGASADPAKDFDYAAADIPLPKPNLIMHMTTLAQQAMVSMGVIKNPMTNQAVIMLNQATYLINTIEMLFEKTEGQRTEDETKTIENMIHELRMLFVAAANEKKRRDEEKK